MDQFEAASYLFRGYFHQDCLVDVPDWESVVERFKAAEPPEIVQAAREALAALSTSFDDAGIDEFLFGPGLRSFYNPRLDGLTSRQWIERIVHMLAGGSRPTMDSLAFARRQAVAIATGVLSGERDILRAARELSTLRSSLEVPDSDPDFMCLSLLTPRQMICHSALCESFGYRRLCRKRNLRSRELENGRSRLEAKHSRMLPSDSEMPATDVEPDERLPPSGRSLVRRLTSGSLAGRANMVNRTVKISATGCWTFVIGAEFEVLDNGDSVQVVHGDRVAYISSLRVGKPDVPVSAAQLRATAAKSLGSGERFSHVDQSVEGDAEVFLDGEIWRLRGAMCAIGTVATCTIDLAASEQQDWAVSVWRSLRCEENAG